VGAHTGYFNNQQPTAQIYLCPNCGLPTFFYEEEQHPGPLMGRDIDGLDEDIEQIYREIRETAKDGCFTATILLGRKLIMHIAVEAGAKEGQSFKQYINFLATKNYVPPNAKRLLDYMRDLGNEKNHEIKLGTPEEVHKLVKFIEALLYFIYELENEFDDEPDIAQTPPPAAT
jgi:hypothetical protein